MTKYNIKIMMIKAMYNLFIARATSIRLSNNCNPFTCRDRAFNKVHIDTNTLISLSMLEASTWEMFGQ